MNHKIVLCTALITLITATGVVQAQEGGAPPREGRREGSGPGGPGGGPIRMPLMLALDLDQDGEISAAEIARAPTSLLTLDKDKDGKLTLEELRPVGGLGGPGGPGRSGGEGRREVEGRREGEAPREGGAPGEGRREGAGPGGPRGGPGAFLARLPVMQALDTDKNSELSAEEIARAATALLTLDKNKDKKLGVDEIRPLGAPVGEPPVSETVSRILMFDANKDGRVSRAEVPARLRGIFTGADANKDGFLTRDELTKYAEGIAASRPAGVVTPAPGASGGGGAPGSGTVPGGSGR